jgi:hypothetical protein
VSFYNVQDLMDVRRDVLPLARRNADRDAAASAYDGLHADGSEVARGTVRLEDYLDHIVELREYDVPYLTRYCIDTGAWGGGHGPSAECSLTRSRLRGRRRPANAGLGVGGSLRISDGCLRQMLRLGPQVPTA